MLQQHKARHAVGELEHVLDLKAFFYLSGYAADSLIAELVWDSATLPFEEIYQSRTELFVFFSCKHRISVESREKPKKASLLKSECQFTHKMKITGRQNQQLTVSIRAQDEKAFAHKVKKLCFFALILKIPATGLNQ